MSLIAVLASPHVGASAEPAGSGPKVHITISRETTFVDGPIGPDGLIDYRAALKAKLLQGVTPQNNAACLLLEALGRSLVSEEGLADVQKLLGVDRVPPDEECFSPSTGFAHEWVHAPQPNWDALPLDGEDEATIQSGIGFSGMGMGWTDPAYIQQRLSNALTDPELAAARGERQIARAYSTPWREQDMPFVAAWLHRNDRPLALIVQASKRTRFYLHEPPRSPDGLLMLDRIPTVGLIRDAGRALMARAMLRLGNGQVEAAWSDLLALHRLGRLVAAGRTAVQYLLGVAIDSIASSGDRTFIVAADLSADQARKFATDLRELLPMPAAAEIADWGERLAYLDMAMSCVRGGFSRAGFPSMDSSLPDRRQLDWDLILRMMNSRFDEHLAIMVIDDAAKRREAREALNQQDSEVDLKLASVQRQMNERIASGEVDGGFVRRLFSELVGTFMADLVHAPMRTREFQEDSAMQVDLSLIALAIEIGKAERGRYPNELRYLAPKYMPAVPLDRFSGRELIYRREGSGYVLYSVGLNLRDDGGKTEKDGSSFDDIVIRRK